MPAFRTSRHVAILVVGAAAALTAGLASNPLFVGPPIGKSNPATTDGPASRDVGLNASPDLRGEVARDAVEPGHQATADVHEQPVGRQTFDWYTQSFADGERGMGDVELASHEPAVSADRRAAVKKLIEEAMQLLEEGRVVAAQAKAMQAQALDGTEDADCPQEPQATTGSADGRAEVTRFVGEVRKLVEAGRFEHAPAKSQKIRALPGSDAGSPPQPDDSASSSEDLARARRLVRLTQGALERARAEDTHAREALARAEAEAQAHAEVDAYRREKGLDKPLSAIVIEGNLAIPTEEIEKLIGSRVGELFDPKQVKNDTRALIAKHWFFTVEPRVAAPEKGPVLVFRVVERPILEKVTYRGNTHLTDEELADVTWLKPGPGYDVGTNRESARRIEYRYKECGYLYAKVTLEKGDAPDDREVIVQIDEGPRVVVTKVGFTGNASVPAWELWLHVRTGVRDGLFSQDFLNVDDLPTNVAELKNHYHNLGFLDAQVTHRVEFSADQAQAAIEYVIDEGQRYMIGAVRFEGNESIPENELREGMKLAPGQFYDQRRVDADTAKVLAHYRQLGQLFAVIAYSTIAHEEPGITDVVFRIHEGKDFHELLAADGPHGPEPFSRPDAHGSEPADLRDIDRLVFSGIETFDAADVRAALARNLDLQIAAHPDADLFSYLGALQSTVLSAYRHCGFPDATVATVLDHSTRQIELRVKEGQRCRCGALSVNGLPQGLTERVVAALTEDPKPHRVLWRKGEPAAFDSGAESRIRERVAEELAAAGYFHPDCRVAIERAEPGTAMLAIEFPASQGPHAVLGGVEIVGFNRDSETDLFTYLEIEYGMPYDSRLAPRFARRLSESGRYLSSDVHETRNTQSSGADSHWLRIELHEYDKAPPLAKELSAAEQALLKLRGWIDRWAEGKTGDDLVATASIRIPRRDLFESWTAPRDAAAEDSAEIQVEFRSIVGAQRGQIVELTASHPGARPMFDVVLGADPDRLVLASPQRQATLIMPNADGRRLIFTASGGAVADREQNDGKPFRINFGLGFNSAAGRVGTAFETRADFSAAFMLSLARFDNPQFAIRDGICEIRNDDFELRIDSESGRLIEFKADSDGDVLALRAEKGAFEPEAKRLEAVLAASTVAYDPLSPWKSALELLLDESLEVTRQEGTQDAVETLLALRKVVGNWRPPGLNEVFDWSDDGTPRDWLFRIPDPRSFRPADANSASSFAKNATAILLPIYRRLVPKTGWMWPAGRDAALYWATGDPKPGRSLWNAAQSLEMGPAGELLLANVGDLIGLALSEKNAPAAFDLLSAAAFARDYKPLLADDSWLGRWTVSLFSAIKTLDERELHALVGLLPEAAPRDSIVQTLMLLRANGERPVAQALPSVLDGLWSCFFRAAFETALERMLPSAGWSLNMEPMEADIQQVGGEETGEADISRPEEKRQEN